MIGFRDLVDGAHLLQHPHGPIWVLIRKGRIVRAEWWNPATNAIEVWGSRQWRDAVVIGGAMLQRGLEGVMPAG